MRGPVWRTLDEMYAMDDMLFQPFKDSLGLLLDRMYRYDEEKKELDSISLQDVVRSLYEGNGNAN